MFRKVLTVEDHDHANLSVQHALKTLDIEDIKYVYYCDHAFSWINHAIRDGSPYDLLVTDLYFEEDGEPQQLQGGVELIRAVRDVQPDLKIIVFSTEGRPVIIADLFEKHGIQGYVRKARRDGQYFKQAIESVAMGRIYRSPDIEQLLRKDHVYEFGPLDIAIIELLAQGVLQKEIPDWLKQRNLSPSSLSSIEKKLAHMKEMLGFSKNEQLIAYCKDLGVI